MSFHNYTLSQLQQIEGLSVRACNVCERHGLEDLESIIKYYKTYKSFLNLQNSGRRTDQELILLCHLYNDSYITTNEDEVFENNSHFPVIQELRDIQRQALNGFSLRKLMSLSKRGQNCLLSFFQDRITFEDIYLSFIEGKSKITVELPNSGDKTEQEIVSYIKDLHAQYFYILGLSDQVLQLEVFKDWLFWQYKVTDSEFQPFEQLFLENRFPLFRFIAFLLREEKIFSKRSILIFERRSGYFKGISIEMLEDLAKTFDLTRERVRQLSEKAFDKFDESIAKLAEQKDMIRTITDYKWDYESDIIFIGNNYAEKINQIESVNFHSTFYNRILGLLNNESYTFLFGDNKNTRPDYLIRKELFNIFDFREFLYDIKNQVEVDIFHDYNLNFDGYLFSFLKKDQFNFLLRIKQVCRVILQQEYTDCISFNFEGDIVFHRNTTTRVMDYIIEVLNLGKHPMNISDIFTKIKALHLEYEGSIENLRSYLHRYKDVFICFGRTSTYGLREWENSIDGIKGGTIRSLVEEYLGQFEEPRHISEIMEYVSKFRPNTNEKNVISNLYLEQNSKFKPCGGNYWGLAHRAYNSELMKIKNLPPSMNRLIFLLLKKNGGMDFQYLVTHFCQSLELKEVQVSYQIRKLIGEGRLSLSEDGVVNNNNLNDKKKS